MNSKNINNVTSKVTGADLVVKTLEMLGGEVIFGIPGGHSLSIYKALSKSNRLRHVLGRHEQGLIYMADGYSRSTGKIGIVTTTSGPGVANCAGALGGVTTDNSAVLVIASAPNSELIGKNRGGLHDLNCAIDIVKPVTRYNNSCESLEAIPESIASLYYSLKTKRRGGAFCEIPQNILEKEIEFTPSLFDSIDKKEAKPPLPVTEIVVAATLINQAKNLFIIAGCGVQESGCTDQVLQLTRKTGALLTVTSLTKGLFPPELPNLVGKDGGFWKPLDTVLQEADVVLAVGTMFRQEDTANFSIVPGKHLIHIDIDPDEINRTFRADVGIACDPKAALDELLPLIETKEIFPEWIEKGKRAEEAYLKARRRQGPMEMETLDALISAVSDDTIFIADRCSLGYWAWRCMKGRTPRSFQYPMGYGGLGGALPQAIGAKLGVPERPVVSIIGDGGLQYTLPEIAVAVQEKVSFPIILCNNGRYGAISAGMKQNNVHAEFGWRLLNPEFSKIAEAYGISYYRADTPDEMVNALHKLIREGSLGIIDLTIDLMDPPASV